MKQSQQRFQTMTVAGSVALWACLVAALLPKAGQAQEPMPEYRVKAAFLYNFAQFVEWPADQEGRPINFCVVGTDPFGADLDKIVKDRRVGGRKIEVRRLSASGPVAECDVAFLATDSEQTLEVLTAVGAEPVLTVHENLQLGRRGGIFNFLLVGKKVRFEVNRSAARRAGLELSSQLLAVAHRVFDVRESDEIDGP